MTSTCKINHPKFKLDEVVELLDESGYTGRILMIEGMGTYRYLVDPFPGAMGGYVYCRIRNNNDYEDFYAVNWVDETRMRKLGKK